MKSIPVTRARHITNFANALEARGLQADGYLARSRLPVNFLETANNESVFSAINMLEFAAHAAADSGVGDLGYWAGKAPLEEYGNFGAYVVGAPTLHAAIRDFCSSVTTECSLADYYLRYAGSKAWFCHGRAGGGPLQEQHELYALTIMMQVICLALGAEWNPARICLQRHGEKGIAHNSFFASTNIEFGASETGIEFDLLDLAMPVRAAQNDVMDSIRDRLVYGQGGLPLDPRFALQELITTQLKQATFPSIEAAAAMAGVGVRTLQRQLRRQGMTYSELVDQVRIDMAVPLLADGSIKITDIAYQLGYSDAAHFSRAFVRLTGMPPRSFREALKNRTSG